MSLSSISLPSTRAQSLQSTSGTTGTSHAHRGGHKHRAETEQNVQPATPPPASFGAKGGLLNKLV